MNPQPPCQSFSKSFVIKPSRHRHFFFLVFFVLFSLFSSLLVFFFFFFFFYLSSLFQLDSNAIYSTTFS